MARNLSRYLWAVILPLKIRRKHCPVPVARMFGGFASSCEVKNTSTSENPSPSHSGRATSTFLCCPALAARISGRFAPSDEAESASPPCAWASCNSERAASAFLKKLGGR